MIFFDGQCNLCNRWVLFVLKRDKIGYFKFCPLESVYAREELENHDLPAGLDSVVVLDRDSVLWKSKATRHILGKLGIFWKFLAAVGGILPTSWSDRIYDAVARRRLRWFGKRDHCSLPEEGWTDRFLS